MRSMIDKEREKLITDFTVYVNFISKKFNVTVELDGLKAETNGRNIKLPNLLSLSPKEIQFLYGISLHECGHVNYSDFSKEKFQMIKSEAHFGFVNALEDARVENILMKEYDGAHEIFDELYNVFINDKKFMKKIFGFTLQDSDLQKTIGLYLHHHYINLKNKQTFKGRFGTKLDKMVQKFVKATNLDEYLNNQKLESWDDVIRISNHVYDLCFAKTQDNSKTNFMPNMEQAINDIINENLKSMNDAHTDFQNDQDKQQQAINELEKEAKRLYLENKVNIDNAHKILEDVNKKLEKVRSFKQTTDLIEALKKQIENKELKNEKKEKQISSSLDKITTISEKLESLENIPENDEKRASLNASLEKQIDSLIKKEEIHEKHENAKNYTNKMMKDQIDQLNQLKSELGDLSTQQVDEIKADLEQKYEKANNDFANVYSPVAMVKQDINAKKCKMQADEEEFNSSMSREIQKIQDKFNEEEIPLNLIPQFEEIEGWDEANQIQKDFDTKASEEKDEIVVNGTGFGSGNRDILLIINETRNDLEELDLSKIFQDKFKVSKLNEFNEISEINETQELDEDGNYAEEYKRPHIPLTTQFDKIIFNFAKNDSVNQIRKDHYATIKKAKEIFSYKMKSKKKDHFKANQEEGNLDCRNIWKLATKRDSHYFEINNPKLVNDVVASIAIDVSGSMDKDATEAGKKVRELCTFISDALKDVHVKHEVCAFHAPINHTMREMSKSNTYNRVANNLETIVFKKFSDKNNDGIGNLEIKCSDNSDGESIKLIATRLMKERAKRRVLFIISDNKPYLSEADIPTMDKDLHDTLKWCIQNRVELYAFGFNEGGELFYKQNYCHVKTYDDFLKFCHQKILAK